MHDADHSYFVRIIWNEKDEVNKPPSSSNGILVLYDTHPILYSPLQNRSSTSGAMENLKETTIDAERKWISR